jgi:transcriptional regulator of acetoin/glycerol metabolism
MGKSLKGILEEDMEKLVQYDWPGNIRELENIIERGLVLSDGDYFRLPELGLNRSEPFNSKKDVSLNANERKHILWALEKRNWKVRGSGGAAELLDIHPSTLTFRMRKLGIKRPERFKRKSKKKVN